ncbi:multidrug efflux SMR transporter [bacterium]|nr:multidrug efflux SMR transporter [bacterium]
MPWIQLFIAGLLETGWAIGLKLTHGFTRPVPSVLTVLAMIGSTWLLALAVRSIPIGTAYAVWVGIGATGAAILGVIVFREPLTFARGFFIALLVASIVGLRLTAPE